VLIGLCGYAGCGKDTVADILVKRGFIKVAFADSLRDMAWNINPLVAADSYAGEALYYQDVINDLGYHGAKKVYPEVRRFLQRLGTDGLRKRDKEFWVKALFNKISYGVSLGENYVISDLRFPNEALAVKSFNGIVIRVRRNEINSDHLSETEIDNVEYDVEIENYGTIEELEQEVERKLGEYL
jgi:hypothetical protein